MRQLHLRILGRNLFDNRTPEKAVLKDVRLVDRNELFLASLSNLKCQMSDSLDLRRSVNHCIDGNLLAGFFTGSFWLAEIQASSQFSDTQDLKSAINDIMPQW